MWPASCAARQSLNGPEGQDQEREAGGNTDREVCDMSLHDDEEAMKSMSDRGIK